jgi:hypothetical protein
MKLWQLNKEFDIEILYPYTFNYPNLQIKDKTSNSLIQITSLEDKTINQILSDLYTKYPNSEFLSKILNK